MNPNTQIYHWLSKLVIPQQDLTSLSFCDGNKEVSVRNWRQHLPLIQTQQASALLYRAVQEIARLKTSADVRLAMLEELRSPIHQCLEVLAQRYLNQPLILPEAALKTATLAQAIQKHLNNAYLACVRDFSLVERSDQGPKQALAIERALTGLGLQLLRNFQLYVPVSGQVWAEIHALYQLACELKVEQLPVDEPLPHHHLLHSVQAVYLRLVLFASARTNQLRQDELLQCYNALETLAPQAELVPFNPKGQENLYLILGDSNRPPLYKSRLETSPETSRRQQILELRTTNLIAQLQNLQNTNPGELDEGTARPLLSPAMLKHLIQAWSHLSLRSFERQEVNADIEVTVGLTNIHFHLAQETPFSIFLRQSSTTDANETGSIFKKRGVQLKPTSAQEAEDDPWGDAFDISGTALEGAERSTKNIEKALLAKERANYSGQHPVFKVPLFDRSPGGFGLEWRDQIPAQLKAGELVGLREYGRSKWSIGVVRWVHQIKGGTQMGVQVLAPQALPVALAVVQKTGGFSEYLRGLQIPELRAINQPASLITNAITFHEFSKIRLYQQLQAGDHRDDQSLQLTQRIFATGSFSQFGFRVLVSTKAETPPAKDDFDSIWNS